MRGRKEHVNFGKFWPASAQSFSRLHYLSPTYLPILIINEVNEKYGARAEAAGRPREAHTVYLESRLGRLIKLKDCQHLKDAPDFQRDNDVSLSPAHRLPHLTMGELLIISSKPFCPRHQAKNYAAIATFSLLSSANTR